MKLAFVSTTLAAPPVVKAFSARISSIVDASKLLRLIFDATAKGTVVLIFHVDGLHVGCLNLPEFTCAILVIVSSLVKLSLHNDQQKSKNLIPLIIMQ